jgi:hypothetical protein
VLCVIKKKLDTTPLMHYYIVMIRTKPDSRYDIDYDRRVFVYKNLHKNCWSIRQDGLVKAHSDGSPLTLYSGVMKVNQKGRERVIREKSKNVHAGISAYLRFPQMEVWHGWVDMIEVTYNPYKYTSFVDVETKKPRWLTDFCKLYQDKVLVNRMRTNFI